MLSSKITSITNLFCSFCVSLRFVNFEQIFEKVIVSSVRLQSAQKMAL